MSRPARPVHPNPTRRRSVVRALVGCLAAVTVVGGLPVAVGAPRASAAPTGTLLLEDDFKNGTVASPRYVSGGINTRACLTAGASTSTTPIPGCGLATPDATGAGALRLTAAVNNQAGFLVYDKALPTKAGLDITFNQYQWGGTNADGISFFMADGNQTLATAGGFGGSLGYHNQGAQPGVPKALLGVGFDVYGNYTVETNNADCTADNAFQGTAPANHKFSVAVRGPGNASTGYCLLGPAVAAPALNRPGSTRPAPTLTRIVVDPPANPSPKVSVYLNGSLVTQVPAPSALATVPTFKFGWGASTGGQNNNHEINFLKVESVEQILPDLGLTGSATPAANGATSTATWTARTSAAAGPVPAGEAVRLRSTAPAGTTFGTPAGSGWACSASTATELDCTRTSPSPIDPDTALPAVSVPVSAGTASGRAPLAATVTSTSDDAALVGDNSAAATASWNPAVAFVDAGAVPAAADPAAVRVAPAATGTGPFTYAITTPADPSVGTVVVDGSELVLTPAAGASGNLTASYTATDPDGLVSPGAAVALRIDPAATPGEAETEPGVQVSTAVPAPTGTGPFTYALVAQPATGTFALDPATGALTATPAAGESGVVALEYVVTDAGGRTSAPASLVLTVHPVAGTGSTRVALDADGQATARLVPEAPTGTGPFAYELVTSELDGATASIDAGTGEITVVADEGTSGTHQVAYRVTGADDVASAPATVTFHVAPHARATASDATATADAPSTSPAPVAVGSGPFTWTIVEPPATGSATIDQATGVVTFTPSGASGPIHVVVQATDGHGLASDPQVVTLDVRPVVGDVEGEATASLSPAGLELTPGSVVGTGDLPVSVVVDLAPELGTVEVAGRTLVVTPAPGVSGVLTFDYVVTDEAGGTSAPATATVSVRPSSQGSTATVTAGTTVVPLPVPVGTGPFTYELASPADVPSGAVSIVEGGLEVVARADVSGDEVVSYLVADGDGLVAGPFEVVVTVAPATTGAAEPGAAVAVGSAGSPLRTPVPTPSGSGPFTFELVGTPPTGEGRVLLNPDTGEVTFNPAKGFSGGTTATYRVVDAHGTPSAPVELGFAVKPVAPAAAPVTTEAGAAVSVQLPTPVGTGPFTWTLVSGPTPEQGTMTLDPATGTALFTPVPGYLGSFDLTYAVTDAHGITSDARSQRLQVQAPPAPPSGPSSLVVAPSAVSVDEGAGAVTVTVTRKGSVDGTSTVAHTTEPGSAVAPEDFTSTSGTLTFLAGQRTRSITVPVVDDAIDEPRQSFRIVLADPTGATLGAGGAAVVVSIVDDDGNVVCPGDPGEDPARDTDPASPHAPAIECMYELGITTGTSADTYTPAGHVTRGQMASFLANLIRREGGTLPEAPADAFTDDDGSGHELAINQLAAVGITQGTGPGTYDPRGTVVRGQMASFLVATYEHLAEAEVTASIDAFTDDAGDVHEGNIDKAAEVGIARGFGGGHFGPTQPVRRDQMATFMLNLLISLHDRR